jgi:hypothetical protein
VQTGIPTPDNEDSGQGLWLRRVHTNRNARTPGLFCIALWPALTSDQRRSPGRSPQGSRMSACLGAGKPWNWLRS